MPSPFFPAPTKITTIIFCIILVLFWGSFLLPFPYQDICVCTSGVMALILYVHDQIEAERNFQAFVKESFGPGKMDEFRQWQKNKK